MKWFLALLVAIFVVLSFIQKVTAWEDVYQDSLAKRKELLNSENEFMSAFYEKYWWGLSISLGKGGHEVRYHRNWAYLPPYFRYFYGGR